MQTAIGLDANIVPAAIAVGQGVGVEVFTVHGLVVVTDQMDEAGEHGGPVFRIGLGVAQGLFGFSAADQEVVG